VTFSIEMTVEDLPARWAFERILEALGRSEAGLVALRCWHRLFGWPCARRALDELGSAIDASGRSLFRWPVESPRAFAARLKRELETINRASIGS